MPALSSISRRIAFACVALVAGFALSACEPIDFRNFGGFGGAGAGPGIDTTRAVPVALLVPRSSAEGGQIIAASLENAARMAIQDLGGASIDLRVYDTAGQAGQASIVAQQAVAEGAQIIVGPFFAASANAAGLAVAPQGVNVLAFSNNTAVAGGNVFVLGNTFQNSANRLVSYASSQGKGKMYIIHAQDAAEEIGATAIRNAVGNSVQAELVGSGSFPLSQQGVTRAISGFSKDAKSSGAQSVFFTSGTAGAMPFLADLLPGAGLPPSAVQYIGLQRLDIPSSALSLGGLQGSWFAIPDPSLAAGFRARYSERFGTDPHPTAGLAYDGIAAVGALVSEGSRDALSVRSLTRSAGFVGTGGVWRLRTDGTNDRALAVAQIRNNQVSIIDPAPRSFGGAGF
ncbi:MAG: ABC transporter substrate-binding protein [Rhodobacteraceae bacterium]|nr:ABC transporter substrate-binding protein [Paracoccaceae bacterium]